MCELLGLSFNRPVKMTASFTAFGKGGPKNPDGWGVAWYDKWGLFRLIKEPVRVDESELALMLTKSLRIESNLFISHIRWSAGPPTEYVNTDPFYRKICRKTWVLAHSDR